MKHITGFYPRLMVDTRRVSAVGQAGGALVTETIRVSGLGLELSTALDRWRKPTAVHDPAKIMLDLALTLALGGDCLADIALLRAEPGVYGRVASDPTVSRTIDVLAADVEAALKVIDAARATARATVWAVAGDHAPDHGTDAEQPLILDVDATLVGSHSEKENARPTLRPGRSPGWWPGSWSGSTAPARPMPSSTGAPGNGCRTRSGSGCPTRRRSC